MRRAERRDLEAIVAIERRSFSDPWSAHAFGTLLERTDVYFVVVEGAAEEARSGHGGAPESFAGDVLGYAVAWFVVGEGEVANIAVHPECQGRGLGASLLDDVLRAARAAGVTAVFLEVRESNASARALYTSRGFETVGRRRQYYRRPVEDALLLRLDLHEAGPDVPAP